MLKGFLVQLFGAVILLHSLGYAQLLSDSNLAFGYRLLIVIGILVGLDLWHSGTHVMFEENKKKTDL